MKGKKLLATMAVANKHVVLKLICCSLIAGGYVLTGHA